MDPSLIVVGGVALGGIGTAAAALLAGASRVFRVDEDPRIAQIAGLLPGANCGGCSFPGCAGFAAALVQGKAQVTACAPASAEIVAQVAAVLGVEAGPRERAVVRLRCQGSADHCQVRARYDGIRSCRGVVAARRGGTRACPSACEGLGDCVPVCPFGAITVAASRLPRVDETICNGCGSCARACPKGLLVVEPAATRVRVACHTSLPARQVKDACDRGCIGCKVCLKACPYDALVLTAGATVPERDPRRCVGCGLCVEACTFGSIVVAPGADLDPAVRAAAEALAAERRAQKQRSKVAAQDRAGG